VHRKGRNLNVKTLIMAVAICVLFASTDSAFGQLGGVG
jgi:hypothetical protein